MKKRKGKLLDGTVRRIVQEAAPLAPWIGVVILLDTLCVITAVIAPEILGDMVQTLYDFGVQPGSGSILPQLRSSLRWLILIYGANMLFALLTSRLKNKSLSRHFTCGLRIKVSDKFRRLPVRYIDQTPVGDMLKRMGDDVGNVGFYLFEVFDILIKGFFQLFLIAFAMLRTNWVLACMVIIATPLSLWLSAKMAANCEKYNDIRFRQEGELTGLVEEYFTNFQTTKAYNLENDAQRKHGVLNKNLRDSCVKANFTGGIVQPLIAFSNSAAYILINLIGGRLLIHHGIAVGTIVTIILYAREFGTPLEQIANGFANLSQIKACASRVFQLLDEAEESASGGDAPEHVAGSVAFRQVVFSYRPDEPLIRDLNLSVKPGQKIAIVGPTGAGKTTLVNLLMRFYDPDSGMICLDGKNMADISRDNVRKQFSMVLQDTWLFHGTIAENVAYGTPDAAHGDIEEACRQACCDHFIRTMPNGYDTMIGEDTVNLSGGQRQLLTIARAFLADRPLLILDEATSNVDTRTEILIQNAMDTLMKGRTCFVIAHRLSTIADADCILVMNHGKIVEQGTHKELLRKHGFYYSLYSSQYAV